MSPKPTPSATFDWDSYLAKKEAEIAADPEHPLLIGKPMGNPIQTRPPWAPSSDTWQTGVQRNADRWEKGIQAPKVDFKSAALKNNAGWKSGVTAAVANDSFAKGMAAVDVDQAVATALQVGGAGWAQGASLRKGKYQAGVDAVRPAMAAVVDRVRGMNASTPGERDQRALAMIQGARAAGRRAKK